MKPTGSRSPIRSATSAVAGSPTPSGAYPPLAGTIDVGLPYGRTYLLHAPAAAHARPLVVVLHIADHSAGFAEHAQGFSALGDARGFVVAYGQGVRNVWNAGGCCGNSRADDIAYLRALVADVERRVAIDRSRVYVVGDSNGAMMAFRAVCEAPDVFAAAGVVGGVLMRGVQCTRTVVHVFEIHSLQDTSVPLNGGIGIFGIDYPPEASEHARVGRGSVIVLHTYSGGHQYPPWATALLWEWLSKQRLS